MSSIRSRSRSATPGHMLALFLKKFADLKLCSDPSRAGFDPAKAKKIRRGINKLQLRFPMTIERSHQQNLVRAPEKFHLMHFISSDQAMSAGVALAICQRFPWNRPSWGFVLPEDTIPRPESVGSIIVRKDPRGSRLIYNLITKTRYSDRGNMTVLPSIFAKLRLLLSENQTTRLALVRVGSGRDRLEWEDVRKLLLQSLAGLPLILEFYFKHDRHTPQ